MDANSRKGMQKQRGEWMDDIQEPDQTDIQTLQKSHRLEAVAEHHAVDEWYWHLQ